MLKGALFTVEEEEDMDSVVEDGLDDELNDCLQTRSKLDLTN